MIETSLETPTPRSTGWKAQGGGQIIAVINLASGGAGAQSAERMAQVFAAAGLGGTEVNCVEPAGIEEALTQAVERAEVVVTLGGDGTIRAAAAKCGRAGKLLIPLAGGTMNMLPRAIYGPIAWDQALAATLADPAVREISGAEAEGRRFFCAAIFGAPSLWADAREALRHGHLFEAVKRSAAAARRSGEPLTYSIGDGAPSSAEAVVILCPLISMALAPEEAAMEAAALPSVAAGPMFRLAFHAVFDDWRREASLALAKTQAVRISGRGRVPVILDGEKAHMGRAISVRFLPSAFRALVPRDQGARST